jgi:hypothetical protein
MDHSGGTASQKYLDPQPEAMERAFEKLFSMNGKATQLRTHAVSPRANGGPRPSS